MKARIFIGSSVEGLDIATAIQTNLQYDAETTIWTQGIFQLSSNSLDDLFNALENFDFGIFIFKPDDITHMRSDKFNTVRDNVIFELGMFFGKLGKDRVFFVMPENVDNFHLPSDLLGVLAGKFDNSRNDGNLLAALGPFCNQVKVRIKNFIYQSMDELAQESTQIKQIAFAKKPFWEQQLTAALLKTRMEDIQKQLDEIKKGHIFKKSKKYSIKEFNDWFSLSMTDILRIIDIAKSIYFTELEKSWGPPGEPGKIDEIKVVVDKITTLCNELLIWEIDLQTTIAPDELQEIPKLMRGWSSLIIDEFARLAILLKATFVEENVGLPEPIVIELVFNEPPYIEKINTIIKNVVNKVLTGKLDYE